MPDPEPTLESFKINFEMAKQVQTTAAVVLTLVLLYAQSAIDSGHSPSLPLKLAIVFLLASLLLGVFLQGRHVSQAELGKYETTDWGIRWVGMAQHGLFVSALTIILVIVLAG